MSPIKKGHTLTGKQYWRSLDELAGTPEFEDWLHREFPQGASEWNNAWSRRSFLTLMGASLALAGLSGCRRPEEHIVPYVKKPEDMVPGNPLKYATAIPMGLHACGLLVESHEGRPTKIEGNLKHPANRGRTDARIQASVLDLYDPDRSTVPSRGGVRSDWTAFVSFWREQFVAFQATGGEGLAVLSETFSSPTMMRLRRAFEARFPNARWVAWDPISDENRYEAIRAVLGRVHQPVFHYDRAKVVLSLESDFLLTEPEAVTATLGFTSGRRIESEKDQMNRLYVVESLYTLTGANADHRLRINSSDVGAFALAVAGELQRQGLAIEGLNGLTVPTMTGRAAEWLAPLAKDLLRARGESLIVAGSGQPAAVHALVMAINGALGNLDRTITYVDNRDAAYPSTSGLTKLTADMAAGKVSALVMIGGNPVYNAPADLNFAAALSKVATSVHLSSRVDETSAATVWHIPRSHYLEMWGDARSLDGTLSVIQPLIEPLYQSVSEVELTALLASGESARGYDLVRETWAGLVTGNFEVGWQTALLNGILSDSALPSIPVNAAQVGIAQAMASHGWSLRPTATTNLEVVFHPCYTTGDGTRANNGWLHELPDPITKLSWDNVATFSPKTARELGVQNEDIVSIQLQGRELSIAAWIVPGQMDNAVGLSFGYGREKAGRVGNGVGVDTYRLRDSQNMYRAGSATVSNTGRRYELATTQDHGSMEGRPIILMASLDEYRENPDFITGASVIPEFMAESEKAKERDLVREYPSSWKEPDYSTGYQWGMSIDLTTCTGCQACTVACQAENNIPIVGKEQVRKGREMHWIRVDRYFTGDVEDPGMEHQPMPCQHCENAPCEQVCPVAATVHDTEGLNVMVYNRCIGTRYCSNNCPYKVRRFNFFNYTDEYPETIKMVQNPEVTVRSRGVMEKCTYCVQRINRGKQVAKLENRSIRDGEVTPACAQACPAEAIVFGNINDSESRVARVKRINRTYSLLGELNTQPRTTYLASIRNPNPEMKA